MGVRHIHVGGMYATRWVYVSPTGRVYVTYGAGVRVAYGAGVRDAYGAGGHGADEAAEAPPGESLPLPTPTVSAPLPPTSPKKLSSTARPVLQPGRTPLS